MSSWDPPTKWEAFHTENENKSLIIFLMHAVSFTPILNQNLEQGKLMVVVDSRKYIVKVQKTFVQYFVTEIWQDT